MEFYSGRGVLGGYKAVRPWVKQNFVKMWYHKHLINLSSNWQIPTKLLFPSLYFFPPVSILIPLILNQGLLSRWEFYCDHHHKPLSLVFGTKMRQKRVTSSPSFSVPFDHSFSVLWQFLLFCLVIVQACFRTSVYISQTGNCLKHPNSSSQGKKKTKTKINQMKTHPPWETWHSISGILSKPASTVLSTHLPRAFLPQRPAVYRIIPCGDSISTN